MARNNRRVRRLQSALQGRDLSLLNEQDFRDFTAYEQAIRDGFDVNRQHKESSASDLPIQEDPDQDDWTGRLSLRMDDDPRALADWLPTLKRVRNLARAQPNAIQSLRLYRSYVLGRGFTVTLKPVDPATKATPEVKKAIRAAVRAGTEFLQANHRAWSVKEMGKRVWRDGEQFTIKANESWPPQVRFADPEEFQDPTKDQNSGGEYPNEMPDNRGIVTKQGDVATVVKYIRVDPKDVSKVRAEYPADKVFHSKIDVDSNEKRGVSRFYPVTWYVRKLAHWLENEVEHRTLQSSIVMQRKVKGGPGRVGAMLDNIKSGTTNYPDGPRRRERFRKGSIVNTNEAVELVFCQPDSNFTDASPLGKWLVMQIAAATGWPYYAISADSSESNFASQLVQESPVVLMVEDEQDYFECELRPIFEWVLRLACEAKKIPGFPTLEKLLEEFDLCFEFPKLVTRDGLKWAQENNIWKMIGAISTQEASRRAGTDPDQMQAETDEANEHMMDQILAGAALPGGAAGDVGRMNQDPAQLAKNASGATGGNQGAAGSGAKPVQHSDKQGA